MVTNERSGSLASQASFAEVGAERGAGMGCIMPNWAMVELRTSPLDVTAAVGPPSKSKSIIMAPGGGAPGAGAAFPHWNLR